MPIFPRIFPPIFPLQIRYHHDFCHQEKWIQLQRLFEGGRHNQEGQDRDHHQGDDGDDGDDGDEDSDGDDDYDNI